MSPSFVLTALRRHWALTVSRPFTNVTRIILRVVNLVIPHTAYPAVLHGQKGASWCAWGWVGKDGGHFEHPVKDDY